MPTLPSPAWRWPLWALACMTASVAVQTAQLRAAAPALSPSEALALVGPSWLGLSLLAALAWLAGRRFGERAGVAWLAVPLACIAAGALLPLDPLGWPAVWGALCAAVVLVPLVLLVKTRVLRPLTAGLWLGLVGLGGPPAADEPVRLAPEGHGPDLVLVTLDTVRADHISAIGGFWPDPLTPALDALAEEAAFFTNARAPVPLTLPAHAAMLTGQSPRELGLFGNGEALPDEVSTVAEELRQAGYATGAFVSATVLDGSTGLARGFDRYDDLAHIPTRLASTLSPANLLDAWLGVRPRTRRDGADTIAAALDWRARQLRPTFTWVHLYDAHGPYTPPPELSEVVAPPKPGAPGSAVWQQQWRQWRTEHLSQTPRLTRSARRARDYAGCVAHVDALVAELVAALPEHTPLVIASDHGEALGEHGYAYNHGRMLHEPALRVPVWVLGRGVLPERIDDPVRLGRVADTLRHLAGLPAEAPLTHAAVADVQTRALTPGQETVPELGLGPLTPVVSTLDGMTKRWSDGSHTWAFDLATDPEERLPAPVAAEDPEEALLERLGARHSPEAAALRALGYTE